MSCNPTKRLSVQILLVVPKRLKGFFKCISRHIIAKTKESETEIENVISRLKKATIRHVALVHIGESGQVSRLHILFYEKKLGAVVTIRIPSVDKFVHEPGLPAA